MSSRKPPKGQKQNFFSGSKKTGKNRQKSDRSTSTTSAGDPWLYGEHAVSAALGNSNRKIKRLLCTKAKQELLLQLLQDSPHENLQFEITSNDELNELLPDNSIHQGLALLASPLRDYDVEDVPKLVEGRPHNTVAVLDQVTDPHNVGAILRSAAAFDICALIVPDRHSPPITGVMARSASGGLESVPIIRVNNLARALDKLSEMGYWRIGMDGQSDTDFETVIKGAEKIAIVLGSEGKGLRRLTEEKCDLMGKLAISANVESLNVSNAAAIAFYELAKRS